MRKTTFKPRYTFKSLWDVLSISLLMIGSLLYVYLNVGTSSLFVFLAVVIVLFCLWWMQHLIRSIEFTATDFTVERYFWLTKTYQYSEVIDIGVTQIKTRRGHIGMEGMSNALELKKLFVQLFQQGIIQFSQLENKLFDKQRVHFRSILPSAILSLIPWGVFLYFYRPDYFRYGVVSAVLILLSSWLVFFYSTYFIVMRIVKKRLKKQAE